jgi:hypothetical protein
VAKYIKRIGKCFKEVGMIQKGLIALGIWLVVIVMKQHGISDDTIIELLLIAMIIEDMD